MSVRIYSLTDDEIREIGEAFGGFEYQEGEKGLAYLSKNEDSINNYIAAFVRSTIMEGILYSTSENHEGYIAMKRSDSKQDYAAGMERLKGIHGNLDIKNAREVFKGAFKNRHEKSYKGMLDKLKIPYIYVSMVVVPNKYQNQGYMRQAMEIAYEEGEKHGMPVILDTDSVEKRDRYIHMGMKCVNTQTLAPGVEIYGMVYEPENIPEVFRSDIVKERYNVLNEKNKNVWDRFAPVYKYFVSASPSNKKTYASIIYRINKVIKDKRVLEIATGPGIIAKEVAESAKSMVATDYSETVLEQARQGDNPDNLIYEQADATDLKYEDGSFDVVIISNALHIIPDPDKVLAEIRRVLRPGGVMIAPNFIHSDANKVGSITSKALIKAGVNFEVDWDEMSYVEFLEENGFRVVNIHVFDSMVPLMYTECLMIPGLSREP